MSGIPETLELEQLSTVKFQAFGKMIHSAWLSAFHIQVSHLLPLPLSAPSAQQVQDLHVPRHEAERRMSPGGQLHLCTLTGGAGKVSVPLLEDNSPVFVSSCL